jgi:hypothetical protein
VMVTSTSVGLPAQWAALTGMLLGFFVDCQTSSAQTLLPLCAARTSLVQAITAHLVMMPATTIGMMSGSFILDTYGGPSHAHDQVRSRTWCDILARVLHVITMLIAMAMGARLASNVSIVSSVPVQVTIAAGMAAGMIFVDLAIRLATTTSA